jgi:Flp pilus assembly protein TadD
LPDSAQAHNELGEVFLANGQTEKALQHFREALRLQPDFAQAQHNLKLTQGD